MPPRTKRQAPEDEDPGAGSDGAEHPGPEPAAASKRQQRGGEEQAGSGAGAGASSGAGSSVLDSVVAAIRSLKSHTGSSSKAIQNACAKQYGLDDADDIKQAIKAGVAAGVLKQVKASYLVAADPPHPDTSDKVTIVEKEAGAGGRQVKRGDSVTIAYKGTLEEGGSMFDEGDSFDFDVGAGDVIKGMDQGVLGMSVGGRREVHIPSSLGYGKRGSKPDIPPNAALVFDITLKAIA